MGGIKDRLKEFASDKTKRLRIFALSGMIYNIAWSLGKLAIGLFSGAYFFAVSGLHTLLIGIVKSLFVTNYSKADAVREVRVSRAIGALTCVSAVVFALYSARLFFFDESKDYNQIVSITIAAFSFVELGLSIGGFVKSRKREDLMLSALKGSKIASALYAIVLTQIAILSAQGESNASKYNAISGVVFGICALAVGIGVIIFTYTADGIERALTQCDKEEGRLSAAPSSGTDKEDVKEDGEEIPPFPG